MTEIYKKDGKCLPITIDSTIRSKIDSFRTRLIQMAEQPDETSAFDVTTIDIILNKLDDYDRNLLIAYYAVADCSPTKLGNALGIDRTLIHRKITKIINDIKKLNDTTKSPFNRTRVCYDS